MIRPRFRISTLMIGVGLTAMVLAIGSALWRWLDSYLHDFYVQVGPLEFVMTAPEEPSNGLYLPQIRCTLVEIRAGQS